MTSEPQQPRAASPVAPPALGAAGRCDPDVLACRSSRESRLGVVIALWVIVPRSSTQGALQKKPTGLDVVGWFLEGQKNNRAGQFFRGFELPSPRNAQKRDKKIVKKAVLDVVDFFCKNFSTRFVCNFFVVFLNSHR
jgi:hypothetical protein